jgi:hypothetical protein
MPDYWMEDYESPSSDFGYEAFKEEIISRCQKTLKEKNSVRIGYVVLDEMKSPASKYILFDIVAALEQTGKYQGKYIRLTNGLDDFLITNIPKKPAHERYWYLVEAGKVTIGIIIGYAISRLLHI